MCHVLQKDDGINSVGPSERENLNAEEVDSEDVIILAETISMDSNNNQEESKSEESYIAPRGLRKESNISSSRDKIPNSQKTN